MATAKNVTIHDEILAHSLDMLRFSAGAKKRVIRQLGDLRDKVIKKLKRDTLTDYSKRKLNQLIKDIDKTITDAYQKIQNDLVKDTAGVAGITAGATASGLSTALEARLAVSLPSEAVLKVLATQALIQGAPQAKWWAKQSQDTLFRFQATVRNGILNGWANGPIIRAVRDEMGISQRHASSLVHTSIQTVSNQARLETFRENSHLVEGLEWVATLDGHVCIMCAPRDGLQWTLDGKPIGGHGVQFRKPPIHFNDRCVLIPVLKSFEDLGIDLPDLPVGTRASEVGPVPAGEKFGAFLDRRGPDYQDEVLGPKRAELWRSGKITLRDLINGNGKELTLDQIKDRIK